jgi:hypothetical protein
MKAMRILKLAAISIVAAGPVGGFIFGFITCSDCGWNIFGRMFIGCVMAVLTPLYAGFPPQNEGGVGPPFNAWPQIIIAALLVFACLLYRERRHLKQE